jgi:hypothetical protein
MVDEQNFAGVNDKNGDGEVNFFVEVGHGFVAASRQSAVLSFMICGALPRRRYDTQ